MPGHVPHPLPPGAEKTKIVMNCIMVPVTGMSVFAIVSALLFFSLILINLLLIAWHIPNFLSLELGDMAKKNVKIKNQLLINLNRNKA